MLDVLMKQHVGIRFSLKKVALTLVIYKRPCANKHKAVFLWKYCNCAGILAELGFCLGLQFMLDCVLWFSRTAESD